METDIVIMGWVTISHIGLGQGMLWTCSNEDNT